MEHLIGKKISVISPRWPNERLVGICYFAGIGFSGDFQVTLDRMPIWPVDPKTIKIIEDEK
jgi:hypothetical protein